MPAAADSERLLVFRHRDGRAVFLFVQFDAEYLCGLERLFHEVARVRGPLHDVDFLAAQFRGDDRDAHAALAHQCAYRVHVLVIREDGYFGAAAGLAHDCLDRNDAARHFGHFRLEEFRQKLRVRTRKADEGAAHAFVDAQEERAYALALTVPLAGYLLVVRENGGRAAEVDIEIAALETLDVAGDYFTLTLAVFGDDGSALRLADLLHDDLLGRLRRDAAEFLARLKREGYLLVELGIFLDAARIRYHDVLFGIETAPLVVRPRRLFAFLPHERVVDDYFRLPEFHVARRRIKGGADYLPALAVLAAVCGRKRGRKRVNNGLARNAALVLELVEG